MYPYAYCNRLLKLYCNIINNKNIKNITLPARKAKGVNKDYNDSVICQPCELATLRIFVNSFFFLQFANSHANSPHF